MSMQKKYYVDDEDKKGFSFFKRKEHQEEEVVEEKIRKKEKIKKIKVQKERIHKSSEQMARNNALVNLISPINLNFKRNYLEVGENFAKIYGAIKYPDKVDIGWLSEITNIPSTIVSIDVTPVDSGTLLSVINMNIKNERVNMESSDVVTRERAKKMVEDNTHLLKRIDQNDENVVKMGLTIMGLSDSEERLKDVSRKIESRFNVKNIKLRLLSHLQEQAFKNISSTFDTEDVITQMTGKIAPLSTFVGGFPFSSSGLNDAKGYYFAKNKTGSSLILDLWHRGEDRTNSNITVLGTAGSGKSTAVKHLIMSEFMIGTKVIIIDPENEYSDLTKNLEGDVINVGGSNHSKINVLQIKPAPQDDEEEETKDTMPDMATHIGSVETFFKLYKSDLNDMHLALIKKNLKEVYNNFGITWESDMKHLKNTDFPIMKDLYDVILEKSKTTQDEFEKPLYKELALLLEDIAIGSDSFIFNGHTTIHSESKIVCLNTSTIQHSSESVKKSQYFNVLSWAWEQVVKDRSEKVMLVCDEAYLLIDPQVPQTAVFLKNFEKRCRKYEGSLVVVTHSVVDLLHESIKNHGQAILDIPTYKIFFGIDGENLNQLSNIINLTQAEKEFLESKERAKALFLYGSKRMKIKFDIPNYKFNYFGKSGGR